MKKMTDKERYRAAFDSLHLSEGFQTRLEESLTREKENETMNIRNIFTAGRAAAVAAIVMLTCGTVCYAADVGGLRTSIQMWLNGKNETIEVTSEGNGAYSYTDDDGSTRVFGGYVMTDDGVASTMSAEELAQHMNNSGTLEFTKDSRVIFHYHNLSEDVTDSIDSEGRLDIHVADPANPNTYFTFTEIGKDGTYKADQDSEADPSVTYKEADTTGLISGDPVDGLDIDTSVGTVVTAD